MSLREVRTRIDRSAYMELEEIAREKNVPISVLVESAVGEFLKLPDGQIESTVRHTCAVRDIRKENTQKVFQPYQNKGTRPR
jgi:predicted DNA-binding ribbon-helix-helix protein